MNVRPGRVACFVAVLFAFLPPSPSFAAKSKAASKAVAPPAAEAATLPAAELTLGFQSRQSETEGIGDLLLPLWSPGGKGLLFLNPRTAFTDHSAEEGNLGLGYRHLLPDLNLILGANVFFDYRDVPAGNYSQWGFGLELLSPWIDARANYYDPDDKKLVVASETETTSRQSVRTSSGWSDVYPEGHGFYQDYVVSRTLLAETFSRTFEQYQQPLGGYDFEVGLRLPLPARPETAEARVFAGYYDFDRDYGPDAKGWKARAELRLASSLFLDAGAYENDELTGSDWFAGARVSVPLDLAALSRGRNPFASARSRIAREPRDFSARLAEMVQRDPQIRLETSKFVENKSLASSSSKTQTSRIRQPVNVLPDVTFVYGDARSPGDGSAERPFSSVQQGVDAAFGLRNVYVHAFSGPYNENVVLAPNTVLLGSGYPIPGLGGHSFGGNSAPVVDGMNLGPAITMANNSRVSGFHVRNTGPSWLFRNASDDRLLPVHVPRVGIFAEGDLGNLTISHNFIEGCSYGTLVEAQGNFSLLFANNLVGNNDRDGIRISGYGTADLLPDRRAPLPDGLSTFDVVLDGNVFTGNWGHGASVRATAYDLAMTSLTDNWFSLNGRSGAYLGHRESILSMISATGGESFGNQSAGYATIQYENMVSLLNLSDVSSENNGEYGIAIMQDSELLSAAVLGMPQGLGSLVSGIAGLPDELAGFFQPAGGVSASDNGFHGVFAEIGAERFSFGAFFDVAANRNDGNGVQALVHSEDGLAVALAGSSRNLSDLAQLGSDVLGLLDYELPIPHLGNGQFQANDNGESGLVLGAEAGSFAVAGVLGAETCNNENGGAMLVSQSEMVAAALAARVVAFDNGVDGLHLNSMADRLSLGLLADVHASFNGEDGISASIASDGVAALLALSTDAIRPIASYLGDEMFGYPLDLPGDPFGPVVADGNAENGVSALVVGEDMALAAFLDVHANSNGAFGFDVSTASTDGSAVSAFLSSDALYELADVALGLPEEIGRPELGGIQANGNQLGGILSSTIGYDSAAALFAGVQANGNGPGLVRRGFIPIGGVFAELSSENGAAMALSFDVEANDNAGYGLSLDVESLLNADVAALFSSAGGNLYDGMHFNVASQTDDAFVLVAGADASDNGSDGIFVAASAGRDASVGITDAVASDNGDNGIFASIQGAGYADFFVGDLAVDDLDDIYDFIDDAGPLANVIPQGGVVASGNDAGGILANLVSGTGDATFVASGTTADDNGDDGIGFTLDASAGPGSALAYLFSTQTLGNGDNDLYGTASSDSGNAFIFGTNLVYSSYSFFAQSTSGSSDIDVNP